MKYKAGDRVKIKSLDWYYDNRDRIDEVACGNTNFIPDMVKYCEEIVTISSVLPTLKVYHIKEDGGMFNWTDEMVEGLMEEENKVGTALNPIEPKSNANCLTMERVDGLATKIDKELPSGNQNVWELPDGYQFVDEKGNVINATKIVLEKKKKEYPKTYDECCEIVHSDPKFYVDTHLYSGILETLYKLLICRDAYWKIAGEEMGLGKPWEPGDIKSRYVICRDGDTIVRWYGISCALEFPIIEMRDAFYENFKEEIEICKELL